MNAASRATHPLLPLLALGAALLLVAGCGKEEKKDAARPPLEVTALTVTPRDVPVTSVYVAQTQSSQAVNIAARVSGFLDKRVYTEGAVVKAGQVLFRMDPKPFQAQVDGAAAALQRNQAAFEVAKANLARTKPLAQQNALSQKDLDDAQGQYEQTAAAVAQSKASLESAKLDLSYTTITSPVDGVSSFAAVADGTYVNAQNSQLTTVSVLTPMWINFSLSENEIERIRTQAQKGTLRLPEGNQFTVEIELVDGSLFPYKGKITFADPSYNSQTGNIPDPRLRRQSQRRPAAQPVRAHAALRRGTAECDPGPAARRAAGSEGSFRLGREQGQQGRTAAGGRRRLVRRQLVHRAGPRGRRSGRRRRHAPACAGCSREGDGVHAEAGFAGSRAGDAASRRDDVRALRQGQRDA